MFSSAKKRSRADSASDRFRVEDVPFGKRARATTQASADSGKWFNDSVLNTPTRGRISAEDDSDADTSSLRSEPPSPRNVDMHDDMDLDDGTCSQSADAEFLPRPTGPISGYLGQRLQMNRVPTPMVPMRPGASPERIRTGFKQHVRRRHPQEYSASASDLLEVPSPIDEDEVPTPPSAAEAAQSRLSMLSVSDIDMDGIEGVPRISIDPARPHLTRPEGDTDLDSAIDSEPMDCGAGNLIVRKQRQRSGALSSGNPTGRNPPAMTGMSKRGGFTMGFRPDCEKCRLRVPGHMNHFIA